MFFSSILSSGVTHISLCSFSICFLILFAVVLSLISCVGLVFLSAWFLSLFAMV